MAAAIVLVAPLCAVGARLAIGDRAGAGRVEGSVTADPLMLIEIEVESGTPGAEVSLRGQKHKLPWSSEVAGDLAPVDLTLTAPGHAGRVFQVVLDRPRRIRFDLPAGAGTVAATLEETDDALNPDDTELVVGAVDAGVDAASPLLVAKVHERHPGRNRPERPAAIPATVSAPVTTTASVVTAPPPTAAPPTAAAPTAPTPATAPPTATPTAPPTAEIAPGTIEKKAVGATVRAHGAEVQACYDRARLETTDLQGKITLEATVAPNGQVSSARITQSTVKSPRLESCLLGAFQRWAFPPPTGGVPGVVNYSFAFKD